jgi:hypothetical protein
MESGPDIYGIRGWMGPQNRYGLHGEEREISSLSERIFRPFCRLALPTELSQLQLMFVRISSIMGRIFNYNPSFLFNEKLNKCTKNTGTCACNHLGSPMRMRAKHIHSLCNRNDLTVDKEGIHVGKYKIKL